MNSTIKTLVLAAVFAAGAATGPRSANARSNGPFSEFLGEWRGAGSVRTTDGRSEPITCRAHYEVTQNGAALSQTLVCASDSYRFDIRSDVTADGGAVTGRWQETTRNVAGDLVGQIGNGVFDGNVDGPGFTAGVSLRTNGRRQAVEIDPHAGDISRVSVMMRHGN